MNKIKAQITEGILSVIVNAVLFGVKFWAGIVTGSIALLADAWHTLSDSLTSVFVIIAAKLSSRKADKEHPFGHGRWEQIASIFVAFVLVIIAYEFMQSSIERFNNRESVFFGTLAIVVTVVSIIVKELLTQYAFYIARKTDNVIMIAEGWHHRTDSLSSLVVLIGILIARFVADLWWMDSVLGVFCSLAIFYAAFKIMKEAITKLLGEEPTPEFIEQLRNVIRIIYKDDLDIHHIHLHNYVSQKEITMHIRLNKDMTIEESHKITVIIEKMILEELDIIATIHVEPLVEVEADK